MHTAAQLVQRHNIVCNSGCEVGLWTLYPMLHVGAVARQASVHTLTIRDLGSQVLNHNGLQSNRQQVATQKGYTSLSVGGQQHCCVSKRGLRRQVTQLVKHACASATKASLCA